MADNNVRTEEIDTQGQLKAIHFTVIAMYVHVASISGRLGQDKSDRRGSLAWSEGTTRGKRERDR